MQFEIPESDRKRAKTPHELFVINLFAFHLLLAPAAIALDIGRFALLVPLFLSSLVITFIYLRGRALKASAPWFVAAHWGFAFRRCLLLMGGYAGSAGVFALAWLLTSGSDSHTQGLLLTVFTRIAVMPTFILILITFFLESGAINQAVRGELPDAMVQRMPPPSGVVVLNQVEEEGVEE